MSPCPNFEPLAEAVEELRVRPILKQRHAGGAERALANVDLYLEMTRPYDVRGLRAFAVYMRAKWENSEAEIEGRPDAELAPGELDGCHRPRTDIAGFPGALEFTHVSEPFRSSLLHLRITQIGIGRPAIPAIIIPAMLLASAEISVAP